MAMSNEREAIEVESAFEAARQGDMLRWEESDGSPWTEHAVVVTADCDLEFNKNRNRISYVPLVRFDTYVGRFWGPDYVAKKAAKVFEAATAAIKRAHKAKGPSGNLNDDAIRDWIVRDSAPVIAEMLSHERSTPTERRALELVIENANAPELRASQIQGWGNTFAGLLGRQDLLPDGRGDPAKSVIGALQGHCGCPEMCSYKHRSCDGDGDLLCSATSANATLLMFP